MTHIERKPDRMDRIIDAINRMEDKYTKKLSLFVENNRFLNRPLTQAVFFSAFSLGAAGYVTHQAVKLHHRAPLVERLESDKVLAEESAEFYMRSAQKKTAICIANGKPVEVCTATATEQQSIAQATEKAKTIQTDLESLKRSQNSSLFAVIALSITSILSGLTAVRWALSMRRKDENPQPEMQGETS